VHFGNEVKVFQLRHKKIFLKSVKKKKKGKLWVFSGPFCEKMGDVGFIFEKHSVLFFPRFGGIFGLVELL
jgi:hypothetical protein